MSGQSYEAVASTACTTWAIRWASPAHIRTALKPDGRLMLVEPFANDALEANLNPVGRIYYAGSTFICVPSSLSQEVALAVGSQAGERQTRAVFEEAGFSSFRRAAETPFNIIYEARP